MQTGIRGEKVIGDETRAGSKNRHSKGGRCPLATSHQRNGQNKGDAKPRLGKRPQKTPPPPQATGRRSLEDYVNTVRLGRAKPSNAHKQAATGTAFEAKERGMTNWKIHSKKRIGGEKTQLTGKVSRPKTANQQKKGSNGKEVHVCQKAERTGKFCCGPKGPIGKRERNAFTARISQPLWKEKPMPSSI